MAKKKESAEYVNPEMKLSAMKGTAERGDDIFLVGDSPGSLFANAYILEKDAQEAVLSIIFDHDEEIDGDDGCSYYVKKLKPDQRIVLTTLRNAKVDFDVLLNYYNSVAGEDDRWFVSRTVLR